MFSTESHKNRVSQLGEDSSNIINVGAMGLDNIHALNCLTNGEIADTLSISNFEKLFLNCLSSSNFRAWKEYQIIKRAT